MWPGKRNFRRTKPDIKLLVLQYLALGYGAFSYLQYGKTAVGIGITILTLAIIELCKRIDMQAIAFWALYGRRDEDKNH